MSCKFELPKKEKLNSSVYTCAIGGEDPCLVLLAQKTCPLIDPRKVSIPEWHRYQPKQPAQHQQL